MTNGEKTMRTPASYRKRALFAVLAPVAAFAGVTAVSAISASGCIGGTDTIDDDDATTDTRDDETAIGGDGARVDGDAPKETSADSPDAGDTSVPTDTLGLDVPGTDGPDVVVADTRGADTPDVVVADTGGAGDTRLDVLDALDAGGDPNAFWIFQIASTLTTPDTSAVNVINGGSACNVFWAVGSSATIGKSNRFEGNIVALDSITVQTGSNVSGRALARTGAVTLDTNAIGFTTCGGGAVTDAGIDASLDADTGTDASADADADAGDVGDGG